MALAAFFHDLLTMSFEIQVTAIMRSLWNGVLHITTHNKCNWLSIDVLSYEEKFVAVVCFFILEDAMLFNRGESNIVNIVLLFVST